MIRGMAELKQDSAVNINGTLVEGKGAGVPIAFFLIKESGRWKNGGGR